MTMDRMKGPMDEICSTPLYPIDSYAMPESPVPIMDPNDRAVQHVLCSALPCSFVCVTTTESDATSAKQMHNDATVSPRPNCVPEFGSNARSMPAAKAPSEMHSLLPNLSDMNPYTGLNAHGKLTEDHVIARSEAVYSYSLTNWNWTDKDMKANANPYTAYAKYRVCIECRGYK